MLGARPSVAPQRRCVSAPVPVQTPDASAVTGCLARVLHLQKSCRWHAVGRHTRCLGCAACCGVSHYQEESVTVPWCGLIYTRSLKYIHEVCGSLKSSKQVASLHNRK
jgi:hypothetical protein